VSSVAERAVPWSHGASAARQGGVPGKAAQCPPFHLEWILAIATIASGRARDKTVRISVSRFLSLELILSMEEGILHLSLADARKGGRLSSGVRDLR
jgi:hypothetical protein